MIPEFRSVRRSNTKAGRGFDWSDLHHRMEACRVALERRLVPDVEEKRKILRARARKLAVAAECKTHDQRSLEIVEFILGAERYGIESSYVREICPLHDFTVLPGVPAFVLGLINVRGQILSVISLKRFFNLPEKGLSDLNKVIVAQGPQVEVGILADRIVGIRRVSAQELSAPLPSIAGDAGLYQLGITRDSLVVLDAARMFGDGDLIVNKS
jgi:purine-binding chemotaxis protein CheW